MRMRIPLGYDHRHQQLDLTRTDTEDPSMNGSSNVFESLTRCRGCGAPQRALAEWRCECGGIFRLHGLRFTRSGVRPERDDMTRYAEFLPFPENPVTLGTGWTPLSRIHINGRELFVKEEQLNPTGSFKDRGVAILANLAAGTDGPVFVDSIGNTGLALATFAEALGLDAHVYAPLATSMERETVITDCGARFHRVAGPRSEAGKVAVATADEGVCFLSHIFQPLFQAGTASAAFEIFEQSPKLPERIFLGVGQGSLFLGLLNGFKALAKAGEVLDPPALFAARPVTPTGSIAVGASATHPIRAQEVRLAAAATGGDVVGITEDEIHDANSTLEDAGLIVDPTSALGVAAWRQVAAHGPSAGGSAGGDLIILTGARRESMPPRDPAREVGS